MEGRELRWDTGTAYDLFMSLVALHDPETFGLRKARVLGLRARVPAADRPWLEAGAFLFGTPLHWIRNLPEQRDAETVIWHLGRLAPEDRLAALASSPGDDCGCAELLARVAGRSAWDDGDVDALARMYECKGEKAPSRQVLGERLGWFARSAEFGERYLEALRSYARAFFFDEEKRIAPYLVAALERARALSATMELRALLEELSQGVRLAALPEEPTVVLAPSFWCTPLIYMAPVGSGTFMCLFGARPPSATLAGDEDVPEAVLRVLDAVSDPTRLRMLRFAWDAPVAPAELARRLGLRQPTVTHHLAALRSAGLVRVDFEESRKLYTARPEALAEALEALSAFLGAGGSPPAAR